MNHLDFNDLTYCRSRKKIIDDLKRSGKPVLIYGAGKFAATVAEYIINQGIELLGFVDRKEYYYPNKMKNVAGGGYKCFLKEDIQLSNGSFNVLSGALEYEVMDECKKYFGEYCDYIDYLDVQGNHVMDYGFLVKYKDDLKELYQSLEDEESRDVLEAYLYARYTGDVRSLVRLKRKGALYDWDLLKISPSDILIDAGAYTGDSIMEIKEQYGYIPQHVFALEPDETTIIRLLKNFTPEELIQIHPILAGVHSKDGHVKFCKTGTLASSVSEKGDAEISVQALDSHKAYDGTTVIKMDIEGCEPYALVGAKKLIQQNHPRMAICIYHNNEDLLAVYKFLKKFKYRIFLRQHSSSVEETVMYAI